MVSKYNWVWCTWNDTTATTTTAVTEYYDIYKTWIDDTSTATTSGWYQLVPWNTWVNKHQNIITKGKTLEKQRRRIAAQQEEIRRANEERKLKELEAEKVAEELLLANLTEEQKEEYQRLKQFHVISAEGKRFRIDAKRRQHNVFELNEQGIEVVEHCIYARNGVPLSDNALAQKLLLETDEAEFRKIANQTRLHRARA